MDCIFCKIISGEIPCYKIYEDENFLAFLDIFPFVKGHTLIIPKKHYSKVWDMPVDGMDSVGNYMTVVKKIANHYQKISGENLVASMIVGDLVDHAHIHLFPMLDEDSLNVLLGRMSGTQQKQLGNDEAVGLVERLRM